MSVSFGKEELGVGPGSVDTFALGMCGDRVVFIVDKDSLDTGKGTCFFSEVNVFEAECCEGLETVLHCFHDGRGDAKSVCCFV